MVHTDPEPIPTRTNILYLYYREGSFKEVLLLYWSRSGSDGYTVLAPFYWHYWSPTSKTFRSRLPATRCRTST